jgi:hypothetical protein
MDVLSLLQGPRPEQVQSGERLDIYAFVSPSAIVFSTGFPQRLSKNRDLALVR